MIEKEMRVSMLAESSLPPSLLVPMQPSSLCLPQVPIPVPVLAAATTAGVRCVRSIGCLGHVSQTGTQSGTCSRQGMRW